MKWFNVIFGTLGIIASIWELHSYKLNTKSKNLLSLAFLGTFIYFLVIDIQKLLT